MINKYFEKQIEKNQSKVDRPKRTRKLVDRLGF